MSEIEALMTRAKDSLTTRAGAGDNCGIMVREVIGVNRRLWQQRVQQWHSFEVWVKTSRRETDVTVRLRQIGEIVDFWLSRNSDWQRSREATLTTGQNVRYMHEKLKRIRHDRA